MRTHRHVRPAGPRFGAPLCEASPSSACSNKAAFSLDQKAGKSSNGRSKSSAAGPGSDPHLAANRRRKAASIYCIRQAVWLTRDPLPFDVTATDTIDLERRIAYYL